VSVAGDTPAPPCGGCRQRIAEFAAPETPIHLAAAGDAHIIRTIGELLPGAFAAQHLPR